MRVVNVGGLHCLAPVDSEAAAPPLGGAEDTAATTTSSSSSSPPASPLATSAPPFAPSAAGRIELLEHILYSPSSSHGGVGLLDLQRRDRHGTIRHVFPLHDHRFNRLLRRRARRLNPFCGASLEPFLEDVRRHFGDKVALYFAFNAFYTLWLLPPSVVGASLWCASWALDESQYAQILPLFAMGMCAWAAGFIKAWQRRANRLAMEWGTFNRNNVEVVRKEFYGEPRVSAITNETELHYPGWRRKLKHTVSLLVLLPQTLLIISLVGLLYAGYIWIQSTIWENPIQPLLLNLLNSTAWGISLEFLNFVVFYKLACALTNFENHRTVEEHEGHLIGKLFVFYYIDCFLWFMLLAFFQIPFGQRVETFINMTTGYELEITFQRGDWQGRLGMCIGAVLGITQFAMVLFADAYVPYWFRSRVVSRERRERQKRSVRKGASAEASVASRRPSLPQAVDLELQPVDGTAGGRMPGAMLASEGGRSGGGGLGPNVRVSGDEKAARAGERMCDLLHEATLTPYSPLLDYAGCVIQFGYVVYFSVSWPLAPLVCALHTMFRLRSNVLRLTKLSMRPKPETTTGIGLWQALLHFVAWSGVLINCLLISVSTDELNYISCWTHSLFREQGDCTPNDVPMTTRFLIAVAAEHILLAIIFLINATVPDQEEAFRTTLKKAAFTFKRRYIAEQLMDAQLPPVNLPKQNGGSGGWCGADASAHGASSAGLRLRTVSGANAPAPAATAAAAAGAALSAAYRFDSVDCDTGWKSGSDLSDAYESDTEPPALRQSQRTSTSTSTRA
jgi:hypothetical protein